MLIVLGTIGVVLGTIVLGLWADRRFGIVPHGNRLLEAHARRQLPAGHAAGHGIETAVEPGEVERLRRTMRHCRQAMDSLADERVDHDGESLRVLQFRCGRCGATARAYARDPR